MKSFAVYLFVLLSVVGLAACKQEKTAGATAGSSGSLTGVVWIAEDIGGGGIIDNSHLTIAFDEEGRVSGHAGCNRYTGSYEAKNGVLHFPNAMASTRMACLAEAMSNQEQKYLTILADVEAYEFTPDGALILTAKDGAKIKYMPDTSAAPN